MTPSTTVDENVRIIIHDRRSNQQRMYDGEGRDVYSVLSVMFQIMKANECEIFNLNPFDDKTYLSEMNSSEIGKRRIAAMKTFYQYMTATDEDINNFQIHTVPVSTSVVTHISGQFLDEEHELTFIQVPLKRPSDNPQSDEKWFLGAIDPNSDVIYKLYGPNNILRRMRRKPIDELSINKMREEGYTDAEVIRETHRRTIEGIPMIFDSQTRLVIDSGLTESDFLNELIVKHDSDSDEINSEIAPNEWLTLRYHIQTIRTFKLLQTIETVAQRVAGRLNEIWRTLK